MQGLLANVVSKDETFGLVLVTVCGMALTDNLCTGNKNVLLWFSFFENKRRFSVPPLPLPFSDGGKKIEGEGGETKQVPA